MRELIRSGLTGRMSMSQENRKPMIPRVGTKKMTNMDFHEILPLYQLKSESKEFLGYFHVEFRVFTRQLI